MDAITPEPRAAWIAGRAERGHSTLPVLHPHDGTEVATVAVTEKDQVERAVAAAVPARDRIRRAPARERADRLERIALGIVRRADELAEIITAESGTPLRWAGDEVRTAVADFRAAAQLAPRLAGEMLLPSSARADGHHAHGSKVTLVRTVPRGPVLAVAPRVCAFGFAAHHAAAALAAGTSFLLVPPPGTPLGTLVLGEILAEAGLGKGDFSVLPVPDPSSLPADPRLTVATAVSPRKATGLVFADWPDLDGAAASIAESGTRQAGQCPSAIQRVVVEAPVADEFTAKLAEALAAQPVGDPYDTGVSVGPVLDDERAREVETWLDEAVGNGGKIRVGGSRMGTTIEPTLLTGLPLDGGEWRGTVDGPVLAVAVADSPAEMFAAAGGPRAGVFTGSVELAWRASTELDATGIVVGGVPAYGPPELSHTLRLIADDQTTTFSGFAL
ncbi:hypothetical protein BAY61_03140 [Prauserella marina]|uniref:Acyl-CoA reductase n=1 Tax=Prauserella marina TaxID=530584 RepID=A0A222VJV0_9PSEU|nr:aldehyde dehydrogenase family protein [Prauserella marina]ASR34154.1 hypothetical protein BAY61_03140 [Prauserella marina]PWV82803.1 acyl-CoA reductase-like NAD-dependent aldehyde dehydrogenase [Prauserella marina]SDC77657.1 Acyl-CoA reductase [Prauserella marina]